MTEKQAKTELRAWAAENELRIIGWLHLESDTFGLRGIGVSATGKDGKVVLNSRIIHVDRA